MYVCMTIPMTPNFHIALKIIGYISWVLKVTCVCICIYIYLYIQILPQVQLLSVLKIICYISWVSKVIYIHITLGTQLIYPIIFKTI